MDSARLPQLTDSSGQTVLLVEDDDAVRRLATTALKRFGFTVLAASAGDEALRVASENPETIGVVLTDVVMPGMSGPQLVAALRERFPRIKVVFMSGYTDDAVVRHGLLAADVSFLQKPFTPSALAETIRRALDARTP